VNLHIPTMFVMILIASTIMAVSLGVIAFRRRPDLRNWSVSLLLQVVAYALFSLRGQISDLWSIVAGNACITASVALYTAGLCRFHQRLTRGGSWSCPLQYASSGSGFGSTTTAPGL
jgi:hypothetical protein